MTTYHNDPAGDSIHSDDREPIVVLGLFPVQSLVEDCVIQLHEDGFRNTDISVLLPSSELRRNINTQSESQKPEGAASGAAAGAILGGALGWLAGAGTIAIPGAGPFIAAGPIVAAFAGLAAGGTLGGLTGGLIGIGVPEYEAKRYAGQLKEGGYLVALHCYSEAEARRAVRIFKVNGGKNVVVTADFSVDDPRVSPLMGRHPTY